MPSLQDKQPTDKPEPGRRGEPDGHDGDVANRLRTSGLPEPGDAALARIWERVSAGMTDPPLYAAIPRLRPDEPDQAALDHVWKRVARGMEERPAPRAPFAFPPPALRGAFVAAAVVLILSLALVTNLAGSALPGSFSYPVKLAVEAVRLQLAFSPEAHGQVALELADVRRAEAQGLLAQSAAPELVTQMLRASLGYLDLAAPFVPAAEITTRLQTWGSDLAHYPPSYQPAAAGAFSDWMQTHPVVSSGLSTPTPTPIPSASPTGTPVSPTATPLVPTSTDTPVVLPEATPVPTLPGGILPTATPVTTGGGGLPAPTLPAPGLPTITNASPPAIEGTLPLPTLPKATAPPPPLPKPTVPQATLPRPTLPVPTLPRPTLPVPTLPLP